ncbi:UNVERIFIED_CONTAM: hypothetical protein Slati_0875600 [Sesamum latifolium]|uniref:Uncharacterized protein n=1 Tax=Sesamum latifolium TaxID=2727402 RepID=A0AAW2XN82_9LAMI
MVGSRGDEGVGCPGSSSIEQSFFSLGTVGLTMGTFWTKNMNGCLLGGWLHRHLQFIGLLETRVASHNITRIQSCMLSGWKWFVDPVRPGNRIWLAWDTSEVTVDVLVAHEQCIHCRVHHLRSHTHSLVTIAYGVNDVYPRRELWTQLVDFLDGVGDDPWIVLGDLNGP